MLSKEERTKKVIEYHELSKHHFHSFAPSLGYLDWATQPDPFRRYEGTKTLKLEHPKVTEQPSFDKALIENNAATTSLNFSSISQFFYYSLALSAWKSFQGTRWPLRINPSSGNLHPTEGYLISGGIENLYVFAFRVY